MKVIEQKITLPFVAVIFLACLFLVIFGHFTRLDLGVIGIIAWLVVIGGVIYFVIWILAHIFG